jgi:hypothetical protein
MELKITPPNSHSSARAPRMRSTVWPTVTLAPAPAPPPGMGFPVTCAERFTPVCPDPVSAEDIDMA